MNKLNNKEATHLNVLNQYIKDLSYENLQKNSAQNPNVKENKTSIDIQVIHERYDESYFGVILKITINCKSKKDEAIIFHLELDYYGFFKAVNAENSDKNELITQGAKILFPFARSIIANITQNGGNIPILLDNVNFKLMKS